MVNYDPNLQTLILTWIGGIPAVLGIVEKLKWFYRNADSRLKKILNYINSAIVSFGVTALFLLRTGQFRIGLAVLESIPIWLAASGIYDFTHQKSGGQ